MAFHQMWFLHFCLSINSGIQSFFPFSADAYIADNANCLVRFVKVSGKLAATAQLWIPSLTCLVAPMVASRA